MVVFIQMIIFAGVVFKSALNIIVVPMEMRRWLATNSFLVLLLRLLGLILVISLAHPHGILLLWSLISLAFFITSGFAVLGSSSASGMMPFAHSMDDQSSNMDSPLKRMMHGCVLTDDHIHKCGVQICSKCYCCLNGNEEMAGH